MMHSSTLKLIYFITHPEVRIDPQLPIPMWSLSEKGTSRLVNMLEKPWVKDIKSIFSSTEQKSIDGAKIMSRHLSLGFQSIHELGENDRSSTGYLPKEEFERVAAEFFNNPDSSIRGWEPAVKAQERVVRAIKEIINMERFYPIAIISHGGVGALFLCYLKRCKISSTEDQPGNGGGNYFVFDASTMRLLQDWKSIDS